MAFRAGRYQKARELFDAVLASEPRHPERATIAFNAAVSTYALEEYAEAQRRFEALARGASELAAQARVNAGFAALRAGDLEAARKHAEPPAPAAVESRRQALHAELARARVERAERELDQLIDTGFDAVSAKDWPLARAKLTRALGWANAAAPDLADAHYGLGLVAFELGESARAERHFEQSLHYRPADARALLALAAVAEHAPDPERAEAAYEAALALPLRPNQMEDTERSLFRLYRLPTSGPSAFVALGVGADGNATQSGSGDRLGINAGESPASAYVSGLVDLGMVLRASRRTAVGVNYSGDVLALLHPSVDDLSLQAHELVGRWYWAPSPRARWRVDAGAAYVATGLEPVRSFEWDGVLTLSAELDTGARSRLRVQLGERMVRASELSYLDGHRLHLLATELWSFGAWELSAQASLRYSAAGTRELELEGDAFAACSPSCDRTPYQNPLSFWSPGAMVGLGWQASSAVRVSAAARAEYRGYLEASVLPGVPESRRARRDGRLRGQLGGELSLDGSGRFRLTLDQSVLVSVSNVAFDAGDPAHQYDYGDFNFVQPITELGISASLP